MESAASPNNVQFVGILVSVTGLLGWIIHIVVNYFIKTANSTTIYVERLVQQNQENTVKFIDTINHQRTLDREMQTKHTKAIEELTSELRASNTVNKELMSFFRKKEL